MVLGDVEGGERGGGQDQCSASCQSFSFVCLGWLVGLWFCLFIQGLCTNTDCRWNSPCRPSEPPARNDRQASAFGLLGVNAWVATPLRISSFSQVKLNKNQSLGVNPCKACLFVGQIACRSQKVRATPSYSVVGLTTSILAVLQNHRLPSHKETNEPQKTTIPRKPQCGRRQRAVAVSHPS